ncbi:hypothetical protein DY000_02031527 [Brassica cretica]|uniref:DUF4283 domain-containing protein n=1 Tax=Brassica cretica TaxID=69181 RepID=A0ABQ7DK66_BRACR|nr:hypothetical protein DY000_02031527 [Brassica cretica]
MVKLSVLVPLLSESLSFGVCQWEWRARIAARHPPQESVLSAREIPAPNRVGSLYFRELSVVTAHILWALGISVSHIGFSFRLGNVSEFGTAVNVFMRFIKLDDFVFLGSYFMLDDQNVVMRLDRVERVTKFWFSVDEVDILFGLVAPLHFWIEMSSCRRLVGKKDRVGFELGIPVWISKVLDCYRYADSGCVIIM